LRFQNRVFRYRFQSTSWRSTASHRAGRSLGMEMSPMTRKGVREKIPMQMAAHPTTVSPR
jgi:hypothetical protein